MSEINDDVKIKVIDSDKLINAINEGSYEVDLSAVMALGAFMLDTKKQESTSDSISRQVAVEAITSYNGVVDKSVAKRILIQLPPEQSESTRTFVELVVEYPDPELCAYKEYKGKPYYSIKYIENGETYVGYGTYKPEVLSQYLKEYFISSEQPNPSQVARDIATIIENEQDMRVMLSQPEIVRCKDCRYDHDCNIQYHAQAGDEFYCGAAERRTDEGD